MLKVFGIIGFMALALAGPQTAQSAPEAKDVATIPTNNIHYKMRTPKRISLGVHTMWHTVKAQITAYSPFDNMDGQEASGNPHITSTGVEPGPGVFAVDPKKIPYGSEIKIIYSDGTVEKGIAGDTGGALREAPNVVIDVFRRTYHECINFGRRPATVLWKAPTM